MIRKDHLEDDDKRELRLQAKWNAWDAEGREGVEPYNPAWFGKENLGVFIGTRWAEEEAEKVGLSLDDMDQSSRDQWVGKYLILAMFTQWQAKNPMAALSHSLTDSEIHWAIYSKGGGLMPANLPFYINNYVHGGGTQKGVDLADIRYYRDRNRLETSLDCEELS